MEIEEEGKNNQENYKTEKKQKNKNMETEGNINQSNQENSETEKEQSNIRLEKEEIIIKKDKNEKGIRTEIEKKEVKEVINEDGTPKIVEEKKVIIKERESEKELINNEKNEMENLAKLTEKKEINEDENKEKIDEIEKKIEKLKEEEIKNIKLIPKQEYTISVIHNITPNVTEGHLKEIFSNYGEVKEVFIPINKETLLKKNYAFIEFVKKENAEKAQLYMDGGQIDGRVVHVEIIAQKNHIEIK